MPYEIRTFDDGDLTLAYEIHGSGDRVIVYMHGLLLDAAINRRLARDLADAGNRVVLLDLPGHGRSDKPRRAAAHRMDAYAHRVVHLLDELGVEQAVVGGVSLGADVTLQVALQAPERLRGMVIEMPVLEQATPFAALVFTPMLGFSFYAAPVLRRIARMARRIPRGTLGPLDQFLAPLTLEPEELVSVLHGVLVGPVAPTEEERSLMTAPALVIGHRADWLHPLSDASRLTAQLANARLVEARSMFELRVRPARLTAEIVDFLDDVWGERPSSLAAAR